VASSLQMVMGGGEGATGRRPKRRRRILDATEGPSTDYSDRYASATNPIAATVPSVNTNTANTNVAATSTSVVAAAAVADFYEPQILGGVGGDPTEPPVADYYDGFGRYVANELRQMDRQSVIIAKRLTYEVLFLGQMGMLNVGTRIETPSPGRRKNEMFHGPETYQHQQHDEHESMAPVEFMETS